MSESNRNPDVNLAVRPARAGDAKDIWDILHSDSRPWNMERIVANLSRLWVLTKNDRIIGVLCEPSHTGSNAPDWVAVHPFFPEKPLRELMVHAMDSIILPASREAFPGLLPLPILKEA
jgi:hypothetical protein